jgi:hypothetical protein
MSALVVLEMSGVLSMSCIHDYYSIWFNLTAVQ